MDALFGLLNGDDIHETYVQISPLDNMVAYVYSRLFFYIFLTLFIYAVLNLFTSLIISAYEESQVCTCVCVYVYMRVYVVVIIHLFRPYVAFSNS